MAKIEVSAETNAVIKQLATEKSVSHDEAGEYLIQVGIGRLAAVRKDAKRRAQGKPPTQRKVTVQILNKEVPKAKGKKAAATAKAPKVKKAAKAKAAKKEEVTA